ncbi:MAG: carbohydrate ABC transporter permease [Clostridiales bacterium]|nr:carbohydrate ABC transporter permease [Clostridiales bacterium]
MNIETNVPKINSNKGMKIRKSRSQILGKCINYTLLALLGLIFLYPFWYCIVLSFNNGLDALKGGVYFWPRAFTWENYLKAFQNPLIFSSFRISIERTLLSVVLSVFMTALMAYALSQRNLPGRSGIIFYFYFTTLFSGGLIPTYILYRQIGLLNNFWVYVLPGLYNFFNAIVLRTFFYTIPESLKESARIDGCSEIQIFFKIMLPLSMPALATIALFVGVGNWNDWFTGAYFVTTKRELYTAATLLNDLLSQATFESSTGSTGQKAQINEALAASVSKATTPESLKMAFLVILTIPIMCIYPFLQKYFVKGVMIGSIKG